MVAQLLNKLLAIVHLSAPKVMRCWPGISSTPSSAPPQVLRGPPPSWRSRVARYVFEGYRPPSRCVQSPVLLWSRLCDDQWGDPECGAGEAGSRL